MAYVPPHRRKKAGDQVNLDGPRSSGTSLLQNEETGRRRRKFGGRSGFFNEDDVHIISNTFSHIFCINLDRRVDKWEHMQREVHKAGLARVTEVHRFSAVDGRQWSEQEDMVSGDDICRDWDSTTDAKYNRHMKAGMKVMSPSEVGCAMSHVLLWRKLLELEEESRVVSSSRHDQTMLILEDDCAFAHSKGRSRFLRACAKAIRKLPEDWGMLYLGFSSRGERTFVDDEVAKNNHSSDHRSAIDIMDPSVRLYRPEYGYHTHAYAITSAAARTLLGNLPIQGPIDVWLADNNWFDLPLYCAVIAGEGWRLADGTYEGKNLVSQRKNPHFLVNDIEHS